MGVTILLVLALAACSEDDDPEPAPATSRPSTLAEVTDDSAATTAISQALDELRSGNSGTFTTHLKYADNIYDYYGSYRLTPAQQRVSVTADLPDGAADDRGGQRRRSASTSGCRPTGRCRLPAGSLATRSRSPS